MYVVDDVLGHKPLDMFTTPGHVYYTRTYDFGVCLLQYFTPLAYAVDDVLGHKPLDMFTVLGHKPFDMFTTLGHVHCTRTCSLHMDIRLLTENGACIIK